MRVGRNPAKTAADGASLQVEVPPPVSVCLLTHVPFVAGFHAEQLDVVALAVMTAKANAGRPVHLVVVDNGSCDELIEWLTDSLDAGLVDQLMLNGRNLGKATAMSQAIFGAPGPDVVFADGDLRFLPNWLDPLLAVRDAFPEAGIISGTPYLAGNVRELDGDPPAGTDLPDMEVDVGSFVTDHDARQWLEDTGLDGGALEERLEQVRAADDTRLRRNGVVAIQGALHCHFLLTQAARSALEPFGGSLALDADEDQWVDRRVAQLGMLRLSLPEPVFRHVGNRLSAEDEVELARLTSTDPRSVDQRTVPVGRSWFWHRTKVRRLVRHLHDWSFRVLYEPPTTQADHHRSERKKK